MKGFVTVILFFLFALAFAGTEYVDAVPAASMTVCTVQHTDTTPQHSINEDRVIPLDSNKGIADMEFGDAHTLMAERGTEGILYGIDRYSSYIYKRPFWFQCFGNDFYGNHR